MSLTRSTPMAIFGGVMVLFVCLIFPPLFAVAGTAVGITALIKALQVRQRSRAERDHAARMEAYYRAHQIRQYEQTTQTNPGWRLP